MPPLSFQEYRRLLHAHRLQSQEREALKSQAAATIQDAFRAQANARRCRREEMANQRREGRATSTIQRAWRRHKAKQIGHKDAFNGNTALALSSALLFGVTTQRKGASFIDTANGADLVEEDSALTLLEGKLSDQTTPDDTKHKQQAIGETPAVPRSWKSWATAKLSPVSSEARNGPGFTPDAGNDGRPRTAAGAVEFTPAPLNVGVGGRSHPASGMMSVRVRIGSEETSLVTPIVLKEGDRGTSEAATAIFGGAAMVTGRDSLHTTLAAADETVVDAAGGIAHAVGARRDVDSDKRTTISPKPQEFVPNGENKRYRDTNPVTREPDDQESTFQDEGSHCRTNSPARTVSPDLSARNAGMLETDQLNLAGDITPAFPSRAPPASTNVVVDGNATPAALAASAVRPSHPGTPITAGVAAKHGIMEDTQVYLGCAKCGLKYLVEAVDPRLPNSPQGVIFGDWMKSIDGCLCPGWVREVRSVLPLRAISVANLLERSSISGPCQIPLLMRPV